MINASNTTPFDSWMPQRETTSLSRSGLPADGAVQRVQMTSRIETFEFEGCRFAYCFDGAGPPLVMIQGVGAYGTSPNPQIAILRNRYLCLSFDNRGIGRSQPAAKPITVRQMARDTAALLDHVGGATAHVVGHSMGGLIAMEFALMAKARVRSLTLLNTFGRGADVTPMTLKLLWILVRLRFAPRFIRRDAFVELVLPAGRKGDKRKLVELLSGIFGHDIADLPAISRRQMDAMKAEDLTGKLSALDGIPTLVISGEKDIIAPPASGRAIALQIPGAQYIEIPGASHAFPILEPERCAALILEHLDSAERIRTA